MNEPIKQREPDWRISEPRPKSPAASPSSMSRPLMVLLGLTVWFTHEYDRAMSALGER